MSELDQKKKVLIELLAADGDSDSSKSIEGSLKVMKSLFLAQRNSGVEVFDFVPYRLGPCSFAVYDEMEELEERNLVKVEEDSHGDEIFELTEDGEEVASQIQGEIDDDLLNQIQEKKELVSGMSFEDLISYVYDKYPRMAKNSEVGYIN